MVIGPMLPKCRYGDSRLVPFISRVIALGLVAGQIVVNKFTQAPEGRMRAAREGIDRLDAAVEPAESGGDVLIEGKALPAILAVATHARGEGSAAATRNFGNSRRRCGRKWWSRK